MIKNRDALFNFFLYMDDLSRYILPVVCKSESLWIGFFHVSECIFLVKNRLGGNHHDRFEEWTESILVTTDSVKERTYALLGHLGIVLIDIC